MGKKMFSFVLRVLMIALALLGTVQFMALLAGTSNLLQAALVMGSSAVLTYKIEWIDSRLTRASTRRKARVQVARAAEPMRVA